MSILEAMAAPDNFSDEQLLQRTLAGSEEAFTSLYRRRQASIYRFALQMSGSGSVAEEVTQEAFMFLMNQGHRYESTRGSLLSFLYGIARNFVLRALEKDRLQVPLQEHSVETSSPIPEALIASGDPLGDLTCSERIESVRLTVLALPPHYREVVVLCDLHEMSYADAAAALGVAVGTIRSRLHRAHGLLVERLRANGFTDRAPSRIQSARCCV
jgi:RNA polymerase sigma-70 factor (ECF subfamily)